MKIGLKSIIVIMFYIKTVHACHSAEDEGRRRKKRQANTNNIDPAGTRILREYFTNCMASRVQNIWDWESVIDATILDTIWYEDNAEARCSSSATNREDQDTSECWNRRLNVYLRNTSFLMAPSRECINQFTSDTQLGIADQSATIFSVALETANSPREQCMVPSREPFMPNSPRVARYATCNGIEVRMPTNRRSLDLPSVFQFVADHTMCSSELNGCDNNNQEIMSVEDPDVPRWPYRYEAIIKSASPLQSSIEVCNNMVFTLPVDWSQWGDCTVSCGGGTQTRTRECSQPECTTMESRSCSETRCPACSISMFSRQRCGEPSISENQCLQLNCCFEVGLCYRSREPATTTRPSLVLTTQPPCPPSSGSFISFQSTPSSLRSFGGQSGFPGSSVDLECNDANAIMPCLRGTSMPCSMCARMACCWSERRQLCYRPVIADPPVVRTNCAPGLENPPACTDIIDCEPESCLNGGSCIDRIQGFECQCPDGFTGAFCQNSPTVCLTTPTVDNAVATPSGPFNVGDSTTYACNEGYAIEGNQVLTCQSTGFFLPLPPICLRVCSAGPPTNPGVSFTPLDEYPNNVFVPYFCLNNRILSPTSAVNRCVDGVWIYPVPSCFACTSPPTLVDGFNQPSGNLHNVGAIVTYFCFTGFTLIGSSVNTCTSTGDWSQPNAPTCSSNFCPPLPEVSNGNVIPEDVLTSQSSIGTVIQYSCNSGFFSSTETFESVCTQYFIGPRWSLGDGPVCSQGCLPPASFPAPPGIIEPQSDIYRPGDEITVSCSIGFTFIGLSTSTCSDAGQFIFPGIENNICLRNCPNPPAPPSNADLVEVNNPIDGAGTYPLGSVATYRCNTGFNEAGSTSITCLNTGIWEVLTITCTEDCFNLPILPANSPGNVFLLPVGNTANTPPFLVGDSFSYVCADAVNFQLTPSEDALTACEVSGSFTHDTSPPTCQQTNCPNPPSPPSNADLVEVNNPIDGAGTYPLGSVATYRCNIGFNEAGSTSITCLNTGIWEVLTITCTEACLSLPTLPANSPGNVFLLPVGNTANTPPFLVGDSFSYVCADAVNFQLTPSEDALTACEGSGSFTHDTSPPTCQQTTCLDPPSITVGVPGNIIGNPPYSPNEIITYTCSSNYVLVGTPVSQCLGLEWTLMGTNIPRCIEICPDPPSRPDLNFVRIGTETVPEVYLEGDMISYFCVDGLLSGSSTSECMSDREWSLVTLPQCQPFCPDPPSRPDLDFVRIGTETVTDVYLEGDTISYFCVDGLLSGQSTSECLSNGEWSLLTLPQCQPFCDITMIPDVSSTTQQPSGPPPYSAGSTVQYTCTESTEDFDGVDTVTCQMDGTWQPAPGTCTQTRCEPPTQDIIDNGGISIDETNYDVGSELLYTCDTGFDTTDLRLTECQPDFIWTLDEDPPSCTRACPALPTIVMGQQITTGGDMPPYFSGDVISYTCRDGFSLRVAFNLATCTCGGTTNLVWSCTIIDLSFICRRDVNFILTMSSSSSNDGCGTTQTSNLPITFSPSQIAFVDRFDTAWGSNAITNAVDVSVTGSRISVMSLNNLLFVPSICDTIALYTTTAAVREFNVRQRRVYCNALNVFTAFQCGNLLLTTASSGHNGNIPTVYFAIMFPPNAFVIAIAESFFNSNPGAIFADRIYIIYITDQSVSSEALSFAQRTVTTRGSSTGMYLGQLPTNPTSNDVQSLVDLLGTHLTNFDF